MARPVFRFVPRRDLLALLVGTAALLLIYESPPLHRLGPLDLRFGLTGPQAQTPWKWLGALALLATVLLLERRSPSSMLLVRPGRKDWEWAVYAVGLALTWTWLAGVLVPRPDGGRGEAEIAAIGVPGVLVLILTAAVTEEIAYRGFLAERVGAVLRCRWGGAVVSLAVFVAPHITFFGPSWLLYHLGPSVAIVLLVLLRRNLVVAMVVHAALNAPILIPTVMAGA